MNNHTIYRQPAQLLQKLIQFDTTNPPGNEAACVAYIQGLLEDAGIPSTFLARDPNRPNLIARLPGQGRAAPLLLYGHVDVVTTAHQNWSHSPFAGEEIDGTIWGRGALDMKGGVAMMVSAFLRAKAEGAELPGDVILAILSDEEGGGDFGAAFLVSEHPEQFENVRYAIGEFGGFSLYIGGKTFFPIQVAEKQICWLKATVRGSGGHGSRVIQGGTMARLGQFLLDLDQNLLPVHITPVVESMMGEVADALPAPVDGLVRQLLDPAKTDDVIKLLGKEGDAFNPLLRNTINATIVRGGEKINVIPSMIELELDGRSLPGFSPQDIIDEVQAIVGPDIEFEVVRHDPGPSDPDMGLYPVLANILREAVPDSTPIPYLLQGVTDARYFTLLGIQTYGFLPMTIPPGLDFRMLVHNADERIPADAVRFGAEAVYQALLRFT